MDHFGMDLRDIYAAQKRIKPFITRTPLIRTSIEGQNKSNEVFLKMESVQPTGSFKIRGAANKILDLSEEEKKQGVITVSSGNHGRALAYITNLHHVRSLICVSTQTPKHKIEAIQALGGEVIVEGDSFDLAEENAWHLMEKWGLTYVSSYDDPGIITGQGTIMLELLEEFPCVDTILVPVGGGGLVSGIALAAKSVSPKIRVIGVSMDRAPVMYHSLKAGKPIQMEEQSTIADALKGGIGLDNQHTFNVCNSLLDDFVVVPDEEIKNAMVHMLKDHRQLVEGGGAVGLAAARMNPSILGDHTVIVITGSSVDPIVLEALISLMNKSSQNS